MNANDLTISIEGLDFRKLLSDWSSLLRGNFGPFLMNAFGDLFLQGEDGRVYFLDLASGKIDGVAKDMEEFGELLNAGEHITDWFMPALVQELQAAGIRLKPGQCYSYKIPPFLNGSLTLENIEPTDIYVHYSVLGQMYEQVKDLPVGTKITSVKIAE